MHNFFQFYLVIISIMTCPICLEEITKKDKTVILTCDHKFHRKCLKQWYQTKNYTTISIQGNALCVVSSVTMN